MNSRVSISEIMRIIVSPSTLWEANSTAKYSSYMQNDVRQDEYKMKGGFNVEKGTGFITLLRYPARSEKAFTKPDEFTPER